MPGRILPPLFLCLAAAIPLRGQSIPPNYGAYTLNPLREDSPSLGWSDTRISERLGRGLVAVPLDSGGVYLSWRFLLSDTEETGFNLYRQSGADPETLLNDTPIVRTTDYVDRDADPARDQTWRVAPVVGGEESADSEVVHLAGDAPPRPYLAIRLKDDLPENSIHKIGIGDLDGDGAYDFVVKRPGGRVDPGTIRRSPDTFKVEAYRSDGSFLWRKDLGWSIELGTWYSPMIVFDLDGDGRAEVALKTGEGDPRNENGRVLSGPEYLTVWDGETGDTIARQAWIDRGEPADWGDHSGNRMNRNMLGVAYLDGKTPSLVVLRGIYGLMRAETWWLQAGELHKAWAWTNQTAGWKYQGQGQHNIHVADIDGDGFDEILNGSIAIDHDGTILWSTGLGHGDRFYVSDIDPAREGLEVWYSYEDPHPQNGVSLWDARTGDLLFGTREETADDQVDRVLAGDIDPAYPGLELWGDRFFFSASGEPIDREVPPTSGLVWWDADPLREIEHGGEVFKYGGDVLTSGIEGRVVAWADILGDWREEIITITQGELRIYTTVIPATDRHPCLMQDRLYRLDVALISQGYEQVPMTERPIGG